MAKIRAKPKAPRPSKPALKTPTSMPRSPRSKLRVKQQPPPRPRGKLTVPSAVVKRKAVERKAEMAARNKLYRMGYQRVRRVQHDKVHGVDLGAVKYDKARRPVAGAVVEVKGRSGRTPGPSAFKKQVRSSYYMPRLLTAKKAGVKGTDDLYRLAKKGKVTSYGATYGLRDQGKGARLYKVSRRGPISRKPI